jgi:hypothetical protein
MTYCHFRKLHNDHWQNIYCIHCVATFLSYLKPLTMRTDYPKQHFLNKYEILYSFILLLVHHALLNIWNKLLQYLKSLLVTRMHSTIQCPTIISNNYITLLLTQHNNEAKQFQQLSITWYCNVFGFLKTQFGLVIGFINNPQVVNYNQFLTRYWFTLLKTLHAQSLSLSVVGFTYSASLNHAL